MTGHFDLRDDGDVARLRIGHHLAHIVLCVETAVWDAVEDQLSIALQTAHQRLLAPRADLGQPGILLDLDAPALVIGEMPMKDIELVQRQQIDVTQHEVLGHEVSRHIEHRAAPAKARNVLDLHARHRPGDALNRHGGENLRRQQLAQRLRRVEQPRRLRRAHRHLRWRHRQAIAFCAQISSIVIQRENDYGLVAPQRFHHRQCKASRRRDLFRKQHSHVNSGARS